MKFKKLMAAVCTAAILFTVSGCSKAVNLNLNIKKGDKFVTKTVENNETTLTIQSQENTTKQTTEVSMDMEVKDVDKDNNITVDYKYASYKVTAESGGQTMSYDTQKPNADDPSGALYQVMIGKGYTVKFDSKGQVLSVTGVDELINAMADKYPVEAAQKEEVKKSLNETFGTDAIKAIFQETMNFYPGKQVKKGETWENKTELKATFPMSISNKWTFNDESNGNLNISGTGTIDADTKDKAVDYFGMQAKLALKGDSKGTYSVNKDNGLVQKSDVTQTLNGKMTVLANDLIPQDMEVPMKVTSKVTVETNKK